MATPLIIHPVATSTPLPHTSHSHHHYNHPSHPNCEQYAHVYSDQLHPVLNNKQCNDIQSHRQRIVKEIFDTEHTYLLQLDTIVTLFLKPIRVGGLLPSHAINSIFSNIEAICLVNTELFSSMRQRSLGEAFAYLAPFLKLYSTYANNFQKAGQTLQEWLKKNAEFSSFVSSQETRPECCGLNLSALLITPVQRVPRYKLLLDDLLKQTKSSHIDFAKLKAASTVIAAVADHINEHIRQHENFNKMLSIQNSLTGNCVPGILAPGRKFLQEGRLMKVCRRKAKERMVFLFSDILIYATPTLLEKKDQPRSYECRCVMPLLNSIVMVVSSDHRAPGVKKLFKVSNSGTVLLFYSIQEEEVLQWVQVVMKAIRELQAAFGSLLNSQKVVLHPINDGHSVMEACPKEDEEDHLDQEETEGRQSLLASTGSSLTPCTPYPLTATLFTSSCTAHQSQDPSSRCRKMSVFAFDQDYTSNRQLYDSGEAEEIGNHHQELNSMLRSTEHQNGGRDGNRGSLNGEPEETAVEEHVNEDEHERTSLLPGHGALQAMSTGSLSTIYVPDSKFSRCCSIL